MSYNELPMMHKTLIQWKYHLKYGYELKEFNIEKHPGGVATVTISCLINIHNGTMHEVSIPNRSFETTVEALANMNDSAENKKLSVWLGAFDSDIRERVNLVLDNEEKDKR